MTRSNLVLALAIVAVSFGCATHFTVQSAPVQPGDLGSYKLAEAAIDARLQLANFVINEVDTQYPQSEKELYRTHFSVAIPNLLQDAIGKRQVLAEVSRVEDPDRSAADYIVLGDYDFYERLGTQGREWIPFAGTFGAKINEAWVRGTMNIRLVDADSNEVVFEKQYVEEHRDRTSVYQSPKVGYLQAAFIAEVSSEIIGEVEKELSLKQAGASLE